MRRLVLAILAGGLIASAAVPPRGTLRTRDGRAYEGRLELADGDVVVIVPLGAEPVTVPLGELKSATFQVAAPAGDPPSNRQNDETPIKDEPPRTSLVLADGSELVGDIRSVDVKGITLVRNGEAKLLKADAVARIVFTRSLPQNAVSSSRGHTGAILDSGDFLEGELRSFEGGRVTISSVPFGNRTFIAGKDLLAIVYCDTKSVDAKFLLKGSDGSVVRAKVLHLATTGATAEDGIGEKWRFAPDEVQEISAVEKE